MVRIWFNPAHSAADRRESARALQRQASMTLQNLRTVWNPLVAIDDPYPVYRRLRDEAPLYHDERLDLWALTRFDDVQAAAKDWETFSTSVGGQGNDLDDTYQLFLPAGDVAGVDPPIPTRLRGAP